MSHAAGTPCVPTVIGRLTLALITALLTLGSGIGNGAVPANASLGTPDTQANVYAINAATGLPSTLAAGRTPGEFGVTHSGAATYRIPLWTPPGVGEVELDLALVYSSRGGNGPLGVGWSLSGLSTITRCNRTWAQDGAAGGVTNTTADRYCLDGQQLKLVSGTPGTDGAVYATEIETFARVVANGAIGSGPSSFTVTSKNGLVYEYGTTASARVYAGTSGTVRSWALSRVHDRVGASGNRIDLTYFNDASSSGYGNGSFRIASISYPTTATGSGPFYTVSFAYSPRPPNDVPSGYLVGNVVREPNQLDKISIQAVGDSSPIKTYNLGYTSASVTGRLRLTSVQECSASSCLRPTTIAYQDGVTGWQGMLETGVSSVGSTSPIALDLNGDGLTDLFYPVDAGSGKVRWRITLATLTGYAASTDTGFVTATGASLIPGQFVGNGRTQLLIPQSNVWYVAGFGSSGFTSASTGLAVSGEYAAADLDGDGLTDLIAQIGVLDPSIAVRRNVTVPTSGAFVAKFASSLQEIYYSPAGRRAAPYDNVRVADFNGDGRADIVALTYVASATNPQLYAQPLLSNGFGLPFTPGVEQPLMQGAMVSLVDWNADGCSDLIQVYSVYLSNCAGSFVELATGATSATGASLLTALPADWNGDGRTDLLYVDAATKKWWVVPSIGESAGAPFNTGIAAPNGTAWFTQDSNGDGLVDLGYRDGANGNKLRYRLHSGALTAPDLAVDFIDGFGMRQSPQYTSIAGGLHTPQATAVFPEADFQGPLFVVSEFSASDGGGGTYRNQFQYGGARVHLQGRGFEGFQWQRINDTRSGFITYDYVQRSFPYTGMHTRRSVFQADGSTRVREWSATVTQQSFGGNGIEGRVFPYVATRAEQRYEYGGTLNGALNTDIRESYTYGDGYGNLTQAQSTVTDKDTYSAFLGTSWQRTSTLSYTNDATSWCLGMPVSSAETATAPSQPALTRTTTYTADTQTCRMTQQVLEPTNASLKVATAYAYDACGNLSQVSVTGANADGTSMPARAASFSYGPRCQLPVTISNALGQASTYVYDYGFGVPTRTTDPNGLVTSWTYDDFGRRARETRPDRTQTAWSYESCNAGPCWAVDDLRFVVYESRLASDGSLVRSRHRFYDGIERLRFDEQHVALGRWVNVAYTYDALGHVLSRTQPFSQGGNGTWSLSYDALGRKTNQKLLDGNGAQVRASSWTYFGRTVRHTDALGHARTTAFDVTGRIRQMFDPNPGGMTVYTYDSLGHLTRVQDPIGALSTASWNLRGLRTQWDDADAGTWNYTGNSLNEVVAWSDAKGQSFGANYDRLGRLISRTEPEGTSTWTWGTSSAAFNIGRLQAKSGLGYGESYIYDAAGRLSNRVIATDQNYQYDFTYNALGELDTLTYPTSPVPAGRTATRFKVRYGYSYGWPAQIDDVTDAQPKRLWSLTAVNDYGAPIAGALSEGIITAAAAYDPATGLLTGQTAGVSGQASNRRNLAYQWDAAGNLRQRQDLNQNLTEGFGYDALDRLTSTTFNGASTLTVAYDASGNITSKSDVGTYSYAGAWRPHALVAAGDETLVYDVNGNVNKRNGIAQLWTSFNLPWLLRKNGFQSQFSYGPDHERWKQTAAYQNGTETTWYLGELLEKEATSSTGLTYWRHYVPIPDGSTAVISRNTDGSATTTYVLADHLGSSETLVSETGALRVRESHSAFGSRRGSDWSTTTAPDWVGIANSTRQGFTGHEMLDNVGAVHMNGRVYDPVLGRFLSVDPLIGDAGNSQTLNPYAYVGNRPLAATDPSGLDAVIVPGGPCGGVCESAIASAVITLASLLGGHAQPPPPATALPGRSAQSGVGICGAGTFSPTCSGMILYAGVPSMGPGGPGTSSWGISDEENYELENLEQFFVDLGINSIDVLILAPYYDATSSIDAVKGGKYAAAGIYAAFTICDIAKCGFTKIPFRALARIARKPAPNAPRELARVIAGDRKLTTLGRPGTKDVFVTASEDIVGLDAAEIAKRLAIPSSDKFTVIRFPTPDTGLASPVFRPEPGFVPGGRTRGGAREYVIPNGPIPENATIEVVGK